MNKMSLPQALLLIMILVDQTACFEVKVWQKTKSTFSPYGISME